MKPILIMLCFVSLILPQSKNDAKIVSNSSFTKQNITEEMPGSNYGSTLKLTQSQIPATLNDQVLDINWTLQSSTSVSNSFYGEPRNINENSSAEPMNIAKNNLGVNVTAGCGPLSLYSTLEYFASYFWLDNLLFNQNGNSSYLNLATKIIDSTKTYSIVDQVLTSPKDMVYAFNQIMTDSDYNNILETTIHKNLQDDVTNTIDLFKDSINKGIPVIWWCHLDDDVQYNHYMVVYAYENWSGYDANGDAMTYPVFKIRYNLQDTAEDYYIFPEMLTYVSGAIIFDYHKTMYRFADNAITSIQYYPFSPVSYSLLSSGDIIDGSYLRTGYIGAPDGVQHLVLSPRRANAGQAYITLHFPKKVRHLYTYLSLWSAKEYLDFAKDSFYIEIKDSNGAWIKNDTLPLHLLTTNKNSPNYYHFTFLKETQDVRIVANSQAIGSDNKGRIVLHNLLFIEALEENCEKRFVNKYAETQIAQNDVTVYIPACDKAFVENMGITLTSPYSNPNHYSYTAKPGGPKIITNVKRLYNDLDSLIFVIKEIEKEADNYGVSDIRNELLWYVRTMSDKYDSSNWTYVAGPSVDISFSHYLDVDKKHGIYIKDYFYSFLEMHSVQGNSHGYDANNFHTYHKQTGQLFLIDPLCSYNYIDLIHMFASMDGVYGSTGANILFLTIGNWQRDASSWAGDLQSAAKKKPASTETIDIEEAQMFDNETKSMLVSGATFEEAFFERPTACPLEDMIADIDAMNIAKHHIDFNNFSVSRNISEYYLHNLNNYHGRYVDFLSSSTMDNQGFGPSNKEIFENKVFLFLGIEKDNWSIDLTQMGLPIIQNLKYNLLEQEDLELRGYMALSFIDYIYRELSNE